MSIVFTAHYGDKTKQVRISLVHGTGGNYDLMIDNHYRGQFYLFKANGLFQQMYTATFPEMISQYFWE